MNPTNNAVAAPPALSLPTVRYDAASGHLLGLEEVAALREAVERLNKRCTQWRLAAAALRLLKENPQVASLQFDVEFSWEYNDAGGSYLSASLYVPSLRLSEPVAFLGLDGNRITFEPADFGPPEEDGCHLLSSSTDDLDLLFQDTVLSECATDYGRGMDVNEVRFLIDRKALARFLDQAEVDLDEVFAQITADSAETSRR